MCRGKKRKFSTLRMCFVVKVDTRQRVIHILKVSPCRFHAGCNPIKTALFDAVGDLVGICERSLSESGGKCRIIIVPCRSPGKRRSINVAKKWLKIATIYVHQSKTGHDGQSCDLPFFGFGNIRHRVNFLRAFPPSTDARFL